MTTKKPGSKDFSLLPGFGYSSFCLYGLYSPLHPHFPHLPEDLRLGFFVRILFFVSLLFPALILCEVRHILLQQKAYTDKAHCREAEEAPEESVQRKPLQINVSERHRHDMHEYYNDQIDRSVECEINAAPDQFA